jgi:Glycosyltransferase family 92
MRAHYRMVMIWLALTDDIHRRMLAWAARARANPKFDLEERDHRLELAQLAGEILAAAGDEARLVERVEALHAYARPRLPEVVLPRHLASLSQWSADDSTGLGRALSVFNDAAIGPAQRVEAFAASFQEREPGERGVIFGSVLGSLFNFATAPDRLPVVRGPVFGALQQTLGEPPGPTHAPAAERYAGHLEFAGRMREAFEQAGIPVNDMIDTEALILTCWEDRQFWIDDDDRRRPRSRPPEHYLAVCAIYRDEAEYLAEWLEFHRLVGCERFYLYNNLSTDNHLEVLQTYVDEGLVVVHDWPDFPGQIGAYDDCIDRHGDEARWIAFIDIDEFLFSPTYRPLPEILADYERWPGVAVNLPRFGTAGHRTKPDGLVIESYTMRLQAPATRTVKSIVDPAAVDRCRNSHMFWYRRRAAVDENEFPVHSTSTKLPSLERLRANHYYTKSEEELRAKHSRRTADFAFERAALPDPQTYGRDEAERSEQDEAILHYAPALREALARRAGVG